MHNSNLESVPGPKRQSEISQSHPYQKNIQLLAERLKVSLRRRKVGEVIVRKEIETQIVEIPVRREKLVVEQISPERKQLAEIDIGRTEFTEDEIAVMLDSVAQAASYPTDEFISAKAANQILSEILSNSDYLTTKVQLSFEDAELQSTYQKWLERYNFSD